MSRSYAGEAEAVARTAGRPATVATLAQELRDLGVPEGGTILVHSSLSSLGWVVGGSEAVVLALEAAVGPTGTVLMPAYSMSSPEPAGWERPAVPAAWWELIRREWPPFDPALSPARRVGAIPETFRRQGGVRRSFHPNHSFCARGPNADRLLSDAPIGSGMGESSPLARLYELDGEVILLGVDHGSNSSLHLSEIRASWPGKPSARTRSARIVRDGRTETIAYDEFPLDSKDFGSLGEAFDRTGAVTIGSVALATVRRMSQRTLVDFGVRWMEVHRR